QDHGKTTEKTLPGAAESSQKPGQSATTTARPPRTFLTHRKPRPEPSSDYSGTLRAHVQKQTSLAERFPPREVICVECLGLGYLDLPSSVLLLNHLHLVFQTQFDFL